VRRSSAAIASRIASASVSGSSLVARLVACPRSPRICDSLRSACVRVATSRTSARMWMISERRMRSAMSEASMMATVLKVTTPGAASKPCSQRSRNGFAASSGFAVSRIEYASVARERPNHVTMIGANTRTFRATSNAPQIQLRFPVSISATTRASTASAYPWISSRSPRRTASARRVRTVPTAGAVRRGSAARTSISGAVRPRSSAPGSGAVPTARWAAGAGLGAICLMALMLSGALRMPWSASFHPGRYRPHQQDAAQTEQQAAERVARPVFGEVNATRDHSSDHPHPQPQWNNAQNPAQIGDPGDVSTREGMAERGPQEREQRHAAGQLGWRRRLGYDEPRGHLDHRDDEEAQRFPPVVSALSQPSERRPDRQRPGHLDLARDRRQIRGEIKPGSVRQLRDRQQRTIAPVKGTGRDAHRQRRVGHEEREARPQSAASKWALARRKYAEPTTQSTTANAAAYASASHSGGAPSSRARRPA